MTVKDIVVQAEQLPLSERWLVVNELLRSLQNETLAAFARKKQPATGPAREIPPASALRGIAKPDGPIPTDEEIRKDYINYLEQKYA